MSKSVRVLRYTVTITPKEDLGSRRTMVAALVNRMRRHRCNVLATWIGNAHRTRLKRQKLLAQLNYHPQPVSFRPRILQKERFPQFSRTTYRLRINPDDETEAVLYLPRGASRASPAPVLLGIHEHGGQFLLGKDKVCVIPGMPAVFKQYQRVCYGGQPPADFFAAHGFAVLVIDQIGFGSRALWHEADRRHRGAPGRLNPTTELRIRLGMRYEQFWLHRALLACGITEAEISLYDNRRSLDFIETIPEVDARRIGAFGLSVGCMQCHQLAAFDPRVKASVRVCWSGDLGDMLRRDGPRALGVNFLLPGVNAECHVPELVALSEPGAVLIINGKQDSLYPYAAQEKTRREILRVAARQGRGDRVRWMYFDGPHCFHPPQQTEALRFFQEFL